MSLQSKADWLLQQAVDEGGVTFQDGSREDADEILHHFVGVQGRWGEAQALGAARHSRVVDRLESR